MNSELLKGHLPVLVLSVLARQPMHGYAVCQTISELAGDALQLGEGTIYPLLYRLERQGYVKSEWQRREGEKDRKVYSITKAGQKSIEAHTIEWKQLLRLYHGLLGEAAR